MGPPASRSTSASVASNVTGSMAVIEALSKALLTTQTVSSPVTTFAAARSTFVLPLIRPVAGDIRTSVPDGASVAQTAPAPTAT
jgi:hypothetical protein